MITLELNHGSPGSVEDFDLLKNSLNSLKPQYQFISRNRFDNNKNVINDKKTPMVQVGFSFGCLLALKNAEAHPETEMVILIAPYLFPEKKPSPLMLSLAKNPFFKNYLLSNLGKNKIKKMIIEGCLPKETPSEYLKQLEIYKQAEVLSHSIIEKNVKDKETFELLDKLKKRNIPIIVIIGEDDLTSYKNNQKLKQIDPLLVHKNIKINSLTHAGHALLWTHFDEISQIINNELGHEMKNKLGYFPGKNESNNVGSFLQDHLNKFPTRNILTWVNPQDIKNWNADLNTPLPHQSVKVAELDHLVSVLASEFQSLGIKEFDRVILFLPMSLYMYASMFALQKMGAIPTFLDSWARRDQMGVSAKVAGPSAMISAERAFMYLADVPEISQIPIKIVAGEINSKINYQARIEDLLQKKSIAPITPVEKEHTALITFTTGSSGTPKGADRSHRFLAAQHYALNRHLPYLPGDKDLPVFPIFSLNNLAAGVETIIPAIDVGQPSPNDPLVLYVQMKSAGVTCTTLSPSLFNALSAFCIDKKLNLNFLRRIVTGGAPISKDDIKQMKGIAPNAEILVLYGSTEVEPMAHIESNEMLSEISNPDQEIVEAGVNVGHLDSGLKYKFIKINKDALYVEKNEDWEKLTVQNGEVGELLVAGEHVCEKYFNNEEAFFRAKIRDHEGVVWHRTGDLGLLDDQKNLWIVGRVHNAIKRKNQYFFPVRAEIIIKKFPFTTKAAFLGIEDQVLGEKTFAVFSSNDSTLDLDMAKKEIRRVLEKNQFVVDEVIHVNDIPMDPRHHSKVEYEVLKKTILGLKT